MPTISEEEKKELIEMAESDAVRKSFRKLKENAAFRRVKVPAGEYIRFATFCNKLAGHRKKKFRKIEGDNFKL